MGSINCDFPELAAAAAVWTIPVDSPCEDACTIGPFLGWYDTDISYSERYVTLNVPEAGIYRVSLTSSADVGEVVLRLGPPVTPVTRVTRGGLHRHRHGHFRADSGRARD